jgi:predicted Ser/Thr protein kinase
LCPKCLLQLGFNSQAVPAADPSGGPTVYQPKYLPPSIAELAVQFPQLEVLEQIGHGGMGVVYKARQRDLDRIVALKILRPDIGSDPAFADRFVREARALAKLSHPAIVTVHDFGRKDSLYYFVMEYIDGTNLRDLERSGKLTPHLALAIVPRICEALQYAHDQGVVHRDIKPENILLDKEGRVKIADFGLAKVLGTAPEAGTLTGAWQVMGTPHYMAPEQMQGAHQVDHRADIYSLGVVIYEMLTGELPVGRFPLPSQKVQVDVRLDEVVLRAMEREPERRYQRATEVKTDIESISREPAAMPSALPTAASRAAAADELKAACIGLRITGLLEFLLGLVPVGLSMLESRWIVGPTELFILVMPSLLFGALAVVTASLLSQQRHYAAALYGCILCALPLSGGWIMRVVFAVLALLSLRRADVKAAFGPRPSRGTQSAAETSASTAPAGWHYGLWGTHEPGYANWVRGRLLLWLPIWLVAAAVSLILGAVSGKLNEPLFGMVIGAAVVLFPLWLLLRKQEQAERQRPRADYEARTVTDDTGRQAGRPG